MDPVKVYQILEKQGFPKEDAHLATKEDLADQLDKFATKSDMKLEMFPLATKEYVHSEINKVVWLVIGAAALNIVLKYIH